MWEGSDDSRTIAIVTTVINAETEVPAATAPPSNEQLVLQQPAGHDGGRVVCLGVAVAVTVLVVATVRSVVSLTTAVVSPELSDVPV